MNDLRFAFRQLLKNPGFAAVAVLTLALGIGANTAIFTVVNSVVLRPLPYPESERLVWFSERGPNFPVMSISYPNFTDYKEQQTVFEHIGIYNWTSYGLTGEGEPLRLQVSRITSGAFGALQINPVLGRLFNDEEDKAGASPVVLLSYGLWQDRFGANPNIVNQPISLDARVYTVVGVMPKDFAFPNRVDVWVPLGLTVGEGSYQSRGNHPGLLGVARLKPRVTLEQARAAMDTIGVRLEQQYPDSNHKVRVRIDPLIENRVGERVRTALWTLLGAVGMVLLIACGNIANLLLARAAARQREMAVRSALGAGRWRIVRQLLTESLLLALLGGALGLLVAHGGLRLLLVLSGNSLPRANEVSLSFGVLAFTTAVAIVTGILFGLAPAWQASRPDVQEALKDTSRSATGGRARLRHGLVVAEVALTLMLLVGAGLMLRSFHRLETLDPGFNYEGVLTFRLDLPRRKYTTDEQQFAFFHSLDEKLRALPGVQAVAYSSQIPLAKNGWQTSYRIEGQPEPARGESPSVELTVASSDYFRVLGIPLLRGRYFTDQDNREHLLSQNLTNLNDGQRWAAGVNVMIVDEEFARRHWPREDPIGQRVKMNGATLSVVGVVRRVKLGQLDEQGGFVQTYLSALQAPTRGRSITLKTTLPPQSLAAAVRQQVSALDPTQPIYDLRTMADLRNQSLTPDRLRLALLGIFAGLALTLAVIGLYGVLAYAVLQRRREIGVRMALGAQRWNVLGLVVGQGMRLAIVGVAVGLIGSLALTRVLQTLLYEVKPTDPLTFVVVTSVLSIVVLLACYVPARRAARLDPMEALRYE